MSLLDPFSHALSHVIATAHAGLTSVGADLDPGVTWLLAIAAVVVVVRLTLLPCRLALVPHSRHSSGRPRGESAGSVTGVRRSRGCRGQARATGEVDVDGPARDLVGQPGRFSTGCHKFGSAGVWMSTAWSTHRRKS